MTIAETHAARVSLNHLIPLNGMDGKTLQTLMRLAQVRRFAPGSVLFQNGEEIDRTYYLLSGEIELISPVYPTERIAANAANARYPLAHHLPRQVTARVVSEAQILCLDLDILDVVPPVAACAEPATEYEVWKIRWLQSPLFRRLPRQNIEKMLDRMTEVVVHAGTAVVHQDESADSYYVIKKGKCSVSRCPVPGAPEIKLAELVGGQGFGEEALIANATRNASVTMLEDGTLLRLAKEDFIALMAQPLVRQLPYAATMSLVEKGAVLIDVRTPEEFEIDGLFGSINMPLAVLRLKAHRLDQNHSYIVYSNTGQFSCTAAFLLIQEGLDAYVLQGGLSAVPRHRMKRAAATETASAQGRNSVLPFRNASHPPGAHKDQASDAGLGRAHAKPNWNTVSDEVLWRSTVGYRQDRQLDALLGPAPRCEAVDTPSQGFGDIHLFTPIPPLRHEQLSLRQDDDPWSRVSFGAPVKASISYSNNVHADPAGPDAKWESLLAAHRTRKAWAAAGALLLALIASGAGACYIYQQGWSDRISAWIDKQRDLDAKITRLTRLLETVPTPALPKHP